MCACFQEDVLRLRARLLRDADRLAAENKACMGKSRERNRILEARAMQQGQSTDAQRRQTAPDQQQARQRSQAVQTTARLGPASAQGEQSWIHFEPNINF